MSDDSTFQVQINGGPEHTLVVKTSLYSLAALAALAIFEYDEAADYNVVKIWVPHLANKGYGPYFIGWDGSARVVPHAERRW